MPNEKITAERLATFSDAVFAVIVDRHGAGDQGTGGGVVLRSLLLHLRPEVAGNLV
jgi:hypothetical protein